MVITSPRNKTAKKIPNKGVVSETEEAVEGSTYFKLSANRKYGMAVQATPATINKIITNKEADKSAGKYGIESGVIKSKDVINIIVRIGSELYCLTYLSFIA